MKALVRVTIEKEIEIEITEKLFGGLTEQEYLEEFRKGLWHVDSMIDVAKYAAIEAATGGRGLQLDGLGVLDHSDADPDVIFDIKDESIETEVIGK